MKLYDMDKQEWREGDFERGDKWRSEQVYRCDICHTKTNKWHMGGWPGKGPRHLCPGDRYVEHDDLESTLERHKRLSERVREYEKILRKADEIDRRGAEDMLNSLRAEKELLEEKIEGLREKFDGKLDDVKGASASAEIRGFPSRLEVCWRKGEVD
ncbi:hypothetical protein AKJ54_00160 [candidate division MSBL1 archaeon SCGC-AAA382K21]|uniref:Cytochrome c domain-containing protein n=1 Tax=candidate division MSBL1 archaeon SCGC-AAA382K21 TaxID=1698283 RepID=A0A133VM21_9EURY|nr:hypothetical protein AKJ54_00160 [candidate division MSBL1 archaeon SCGC-AAA382K21]